MELFVPSRAKGAGGGVVGEEDVDAGLSSGEEELVEGVRRAR
ncbi:hypothetical protein [Streptomyces sp. LN245]